MIFEIINPSDMITIESDEPIIAGLAITLISRGQYCINDEQGNSPVPLFIFGGFDNWLKEQKINDFDAWISKNALKIADALESVLYGDASDRKIFEAAVSKMSKEDAVKFRTEWNENKRSSMNNIGSVCQQYAEKLRKLAALEEKTI